jgi:hypothetical protein
LGGPGSPFLESEEQRNNQKADSFARGKLIVPLERTWTQGHEDSPHLLLDPEGFGLVVKTKKKPSVWGWQLDHPCPCMAILVIVMVYMFIYSCRDKSFVDVLSLKSVIFTVLLDYPLVI